MKKELLFAAVFLGGTIYSVFAQGEYIFKNLPETITATFSVNTKKTVPANNKLLGYNIFQFTTAADQNFIRKYDPITIRFPHGVWANFYNWETDGYTRYGDTWKSGHAATVETYIKLNTKCGFPGLTDLNLEKKKQNGGAGYDVLWTYNIDYDDAQKSVARLKDSEQKGFKVLAVELGNEHFWRSQRSSQVSTPEKFVAAAREVSKALKEVRPVLKVSLPLSWRSEHNEYNTIVVDDGSYFDAITLHSYIGEGGGDPTKAEESDVSTAANLTARLTLAESIAVVRKYAPGKPVWLSEWGVKNSKGKRAAEAIGMADCYLYLFENQNLCERANWFSVNGLGNSFVTVSDKRKIKYPLEKTCYGAVYGIIRAFFENSALLDSEITTETFSTDKGSINAVSARAVNKNGDVSIIALNLTDKPAHFKISLDGKKIDQKCKQEALVFESLDEIRVWPFDDNPLKPVAHTTEGIVLPPLSINIISGM